MALKETTESVQFSKTLEDLSDEAEMADGKLSREVVDNLYLRRDVNPDDAIKIEKILRQKGYSIEDTTEHGKLEPIKLEERSAAYKSALDQLISSAKRFPVLSADQEAAYGEAVQRGLLLSEKPDGERSDVEDRLVSNRKRSLDALITHNIRLVISIALDRHYRDRHDIDDIVQMGLLGLMRAAEKFDPAHGCRFSTYAMWWIKQSIHRGIANDSNTIRLPIHMIQTVSKFRRAKRALDESRKSNRNTINRLAEKLGWNTDYTARIAQIAEMRTVSFDAPIGDSDSVTLGEFIQDERPNPEDIMVAKDTTSHVRSLVGELSNERQRDIIKRRFGFSGIDETLESIGIRYSLTRERIRQIEVKALKNLQRIVLRKKYRRLGED